MPDPILTRLDSIEKALTQGDRPLTFREAAGYLDCSLSYLYKLTADERRRLAQAFDEAEEKQVSFISHVVLSQLRIPGATCKTL
jgi:hypothetical protein